MKRDYHFSTDKIWNESENVRNMQRVYVNILHAELWK